MKKHRVKFTTGVFTRIGCTNKGHTDAEGQPFDRALDIDARVHSRGWQPLASESCSVLRRFIRVLGGRHLAVLHVGEHLPLHMLHAQW
jgi:hypothetical protein